jgi:hypothetical protein
MMKITKNDKVSRKIKFFSENHALNKKLNRNLKKVPFNNVFIGLEKDLLSFLDLGDDMDFYGMLVTSKVN